MTQFDDKGRQLYQAQKQQDQMRLRLFMAQEQLAKTQAAKQRLDRYFNQNTPEYQTRQQQLQTKQARTEATILQMRSSLDQASQVAAGLSAEFLQFTDPRTNLQFKRTDYPFLLFPLRLETRFKSIEIPGPDGSELQSVEQLWVRVYPDDCLVDTFEPVPSESEISSAQKFWLNWVKAGGVEALQRGAWRSLVAGFGAGRSAWLIQQYVPDMSTPFPQKTDQGDGSVNHVILVINTEQPLPSEEKLAVERFWITWWQAAGVASTQQAAFDVLENDIGTDRAAVIRDRYVPVNLADTPPPSHTYANASVAVAFLDFPDLEQAQTQRQTWTQAPRVTVLPERLVLLGYRKGEQVLEQLGENIPTPLITGPDPLATEADQLRLENGNVVVSDAMRWMVDFDRAVKVGMGFRVNLSPEDVELGFDQLLVLGVQLRADASAGQEMLETLFHHHEVGNSGFSLVPQGMPTNNTEGEGSGFSEREDADDTYDLVFNSEPLNHESDWRSRSDGQWLAELLGIRISIFERTPFARGRDQCEARAMNAALWPGTWGYLMESMMAPVFDAQTIENTRWFFTNFVSARGLLPALRIGDQPYGILPTTVFSRVTWLQEDQWPRPLGVPHPSNYRDYLLGLHRVLGIMRADWQEMVPKVSYVGKPGDPHQILLDVVGLHPSSAEYYQRYAESLEQLSNRLKLEGFGEQLELALIALGYPQSGIDLLARLGFEEEEMPEILEKFFLNEPNKLLGELIDDQSLSEINPIRAYTDDDRNYIRWLIDAAETSFDTLRKEEGFSENKKPRTLLYLMLRYALEQGYWDAGLRLFETFEVLSPTQLITARLDPSFVHVADRSLKVTLEPSPNPLVTSGKPVRLDQRSESRYEYLYQTAPTITNNPDLLVADYIPRVISQLPATRYLYQQIEALKHLENTPTARLERLFAEHVDLCTYRLDAWRWGLLNYQLMGMRYGKRPKQKQPPAQQGIYLGAFGILEQVKKSDNEQLTPVKLDKELDKIFNPPDVADLPPLMRDSTNGGFIHAPSLNHAITAAILRNGYIANATPDQPDLLKVNLSSERVRLAMGIIEGIRNGQTLGALLGYQLERGLHDRHTEAEVDQFIFDLRKAFPLVANRFRDTQVDETDPIQSIEARNVVNGYALINQIKQSGTKTYPFGKSSLPQNGITDAQRAVINTEVNRILDIHDAVADLVIAEGVYQAVQGNYGRVASNLDAYAKGTFPPEPEVVQTPRSGTNLTHRMGLHFKAGLDPNIPPNTLSVTPRTHAEPAVNTWLNDLLPNPATVICKATYFDPADNNPKTVEISQQQLGLQPIDMLYLINPEVNQAMTELDDLVVDHVLTNYNPRWDVDIEIQYVFKELDKVSFFELGAMLNSLRSLILKSRPLNAADIALPTEARQDILAKVSLDHERLTPLVSQLDQLVVNSTPGTDDLNTLIAHLNLWLSNPETHRSDILEEIDDWIERMMVLFIQAMQFGIPQAGIGFAYDWKKQQFRVLRSKVDELIERWQGQLNRFNSILITDYAATTTDEERFTLLRRAEGLVTTQLTVPLPAVPADYLLAVQTKGTAFETVLDQFRTFQTSANTALAPLLMDIKNQLPLDVFQYQVLDVTDVEDEILRFARDLYNQITRLQTEILRRKKDAEEQINLALEAGEATAKVKGLTQAAQTLFGEEFKIVPEFSLSENQASELMKSWDDRTQLMSYLTDMEPAGLGFAFPVDEWLYGVARVREDAADWERVTMLSQAFGTSLPTLSPIQLPYRENDHWLALPYPSNYEFDGDRLLYTAHYPADVLSPFNPNTNQCGLLLDEWTEVVPTREETTGITFNYNRPSSEPPQTMLLVTSPHLEGDWRWKDLVDAIRETMEEARLRAVEPAQVDDTSYARFLPATISAATFHPITIMLNWALNNNVYRLINTEEDA